MPHLQCKDKVPGGLSLLYPSIGFASGKSIDLLLLAVTSLMIHHIALRSEALFALTALKRSLICVNPLMDSQVLLL